MSIAVETNQIASATSASSVTTPAITPAKNNRLLMAFAGNSNGSTAPVAYSDMTFGGAQMTPKWDVTQKVYLHNVCEYTVNPPTTAGAVTYTLASSDSLLFVIAVALSGVDQVTPLDTDAGAAVDAGTATVNGTIASRVGDVVAEAFLGGGTAIVASQNETASIQIQNVSGASFGVAVSNGAASVTTGFTRTGTSLAAGIEFVNIRAQGPLVSKIHLGVGFGF